MYSSSLLDVTRMVYKPWEPCINKSFLHAAGCTRIIQVNCPPTRNGSKQVLRHTGEHEHTSTSHQISRQESSRSHGSLKVDQGRNLRDATVASWCRQTKSPQAIHARCGTNMTAFHFGCDLEARGERGTPEPKTKHPPMSNQVGGVLKQRSGQTMSAPRNTKRRRQFMLMRVEGGWDQA